MFGQLKEASLDSLKTISSTTVKPRKIAQCSVFQTSRALTVSVCFGFTKVRCNITEVLSQQTAIYLTNLSWFSFSDKYYTDIISWHLPLSHRPKINVLAARLE